MQNWTCPQLDEGRHIGDALADAAVAELMGDLEVEDPGWLFHRLVKELNVDIENADTHVQHYLAEARKVPEWADLELIGKGQQWFGEYLVHQFAMLFLTSLPSAYAAAKGAHALVLTGQLTGHVRRRLNETSQFVMDVNSKGAFESGGIAPDRIAHVRLMHAAVRWLINNDRERKYLVDSADRQHGVHPHPVWAKEWGVPVNQEDLAGTMLTFTTVVFNGLDRCKVQYSDEDRDAYFHLWQVIAAMLGIHPEFIPDDVASAERLQALIWRRQHIHNDAGIELEKALLHAADQGSGRYLGWLFPAMSRVVMDPGVPDMVGVPPASWSAKAAIGVLEVLTVPWSLLKKDVGPVAHLVGRLGTRLMDHTLSEARHGDRVPFSVPTSLVDDPK